jgi:hypothetical protein
MRILGYNTCFFIQKNLMGQRYKKVNAMGIVLKKDYREKF